MQRNKGAALLLERSRQRRMCYNRLPLKRVLDTCQRNILQYPFLVIRQRKVRIRQCLSVANDGKRMIADHTTMIRLLGITRVLIYQMLHLIGAVHHHQQRGNSQFTTGTCGQTRHTTTCVLLQRGNKLLHIATLNGLAS